MNDITDLHDAAVEPHSEGMELGLLGILFDGISTEMTFRGYKVTITRRFLEIRHPVTDTVMGGKLHLRNETIATAHDWLTAKVEHYGERQ